MMAEDLFTLARTIYGEARSEPMNGKIAVAHTVINRVKAQSWYGDTITEVCRKPYQFSCWNDDDPNLSKLTAVTADDKQFRLCLYAAVAAMDGLLPDPTSGATHYHSKAVMPSWAVGKRPVCSIGVHQFYQPEEIDG